ncbi:MAG: GNAT family N-acetyltransferase [Pseudomonadota bacterium]
MLGALEITTKRLRLRPLLAEDTARIVEMLNMLEISRWLAQIPHPFTEADCRIVDESGLPLWPRNMGIEQTGALIGTVSTIPHFGYYLDPAYWGRGFMAEAAQAALDHVFVWQERDEISSGYFEGNEASGRILEGLGFRHTGSSTITSRATGTAHHHADMVITRKDWEARR